MTRPARLTLLALLVVLLFGLSLMSGKVWVPLAAWVVLEDDLMGPPRVLAAGTLDDRVLGMVTSVASRVIRLGEELVTANLQDHLVSAPAVAALGLPLVARGAVIGAVVGLAAERAEAR